MDIIYLGHSSFKLRGKNATVITDPYSEDFVGLKFPKHSSADIVTISHEHDDHNFTAQIEGNPYIVRGPGEYEIKGVEIVGQASFHDDEKGGKRGVNTIYRIEIDGISIVHLGDLGHPLTATEVESLDGVDVLLVPVGGFFTIDPATASAIVNEIEPLIVIPMHYGRSGLSQEFEKLAPVSAFLKEIGKEDVLPVPKLTVLRDKLPEDMQVVVFE